MRAVKQNCLVLFVKMDAALLFLLAFDLQIATSTIEDLNLENSRLKIVGLSILRRIVVLKLLRFRILDFLYSSDSKRFTDVLRMRPSLI